MKKSDFWKSKYIKPDDLNGKPVTLTIKSVKREALKTNGREDAKPVMYFAEAQKGLILNMTNFDSAVDLTGEGDTEKWPGHRIELYPSTVEVSGEVKPCIRIREPSQGDLLDKPPPGVAGDLNDPIPF